MIITPMRGELALVDTNILLTATDRSRPQHSAARALFTEALADFTGFPEIKIFSPDSFLEVL